MTNTLAYKMRKEYLKGAIHHMTKRNMGLCYGENGELLSVDACKRELSELTTTS